MRYINYLELVGFMLLLTILVYYTNCPCFSHDCWSAGAGEKEENLQILNSQNQTEYSSTYAWAASELKLFCHSNLSDYSCHFIIISIISKVSCTAGSWGGGIENEHDY